MNAKIGVVGAAFAIFLVSPVIGAEMGEQQRSQQQMQMQQESQSRQQQMSQAQQQQRMTQMRQVAYESDNLVGHEVVNNQGERLGKIRNLAIGPNGQVTYAVLGIGGFAGMGEKEVAIPFNQLQISSDRITLDASREQVSSEFAAFEDIRRGEGMQEEQQQREMERERERGMEE